MIGLWGDDWFLRSQRRPVGHVAPDRKQAAQHELRLVGVALDGLLEIVVEVFHLIDLQGHQGHVGPVVLVVLAQQGEDALELRVEARKILRAGETEIDRHEEHQLVLARPDRIVEPLVGLLVATQGRETDGHGQGRETIGLLLEQVVVALEELQGLLVVLHSDQRSTLEVDGLGVLRIDGDGVVARLDTLFVVLLRLLRLCQVEPAIDVVGFVVGELLQQSLALAIDVVQAREDQHLALDALVVGMLAVLDQVEPGEGQFREAVVVHHLGHVEGKLVLILLAEFGVTGAEIVLHRADLLLVDQDLRHEVVVFHVGLVLHEVGIGLGLVGIVLHRERIARLEGQRLYGARIEVEGEVGDLHRLVVLTLDGIILDDVAQFARHEIVGDACPARLLVASEQFAKLLGVVIFLHVISLWSWPRVAQASRGHG